MFWRFGGNSDEGQGDEAAISGLDEDTKQLEDRKQLQYHNQRRVHSQGSKPSKFSEPSHSKAIVSRGEGKDLDINEVISGLRHMRKKIHRTSLLSPKSTSQVSFRQYARRKFGDLKEEALIKTLGTRNVAARAEVNATAPNDTGIAKRKGIPFGHTDDLSRHLSANIESSFGHMLPQVGHGFTPTSAPITETLHTDQFEHIDSKDYSTLDMDDLLDATTYTDGSPGRTNNVFDFLDEPDSQSTDNAQKNDSAVTQDERLAYTSLNLNPASLTADHNTFVDQHHDMRDYPQRIRTTPAPRRQRHPDLIQQTQASSAPTGHPISFHHPGSTQLRQGYQASLSNIRGAQNYRRRGAPVDMTKGRTFEELPNAFSANRHYTISQDHTAGEETRKSHMLANFGRRCGANMDERKQLEVADYELNPPAINAELE